ncbi:MAG: PEP-CTERM sorting domain-containing protein [Verrucomicrobia bacterium]|nr:PEP-CTERM sorting domain-containing protein [Verrucomicrobiota bacterium]
MTWEMRGYAGNGLVDLSDAGASYRISGPFTATKPSGGVFSLTESGDLFPVDVSAFVSDLYSQGATHVGFAVLPTAFPSDSGTFSFDIERTGDLSTPWGDPTLTITSAPIPEPSQLLLFLSGTFLSIARRRRPGDYPNNCRHLTNLALDNLAPIAFQSLP